MKHMWGVSDDELLWNFDWLCLQKVFYEIENWVKGQESP